MTTCESCAGTCCIVYSFIELTEKECEKIAAYLELDLISFQNMYVQDAPEDCDLEFAFKQVKRVLPKTSESDEPFSDHFFPLECTFLDSTGKCIIYPVRPSTCQKFPSNCDIHCLDLTKLSGYQCAWWYVKAAEIPPSGKYTFQEKLDLILENSEELKDFT